MQIKIDEAESLATDVLQKFGFSESDSLSATNVLIGGELVGKPSHGLVRLVSMKKMIDDGRVSVNQIATEIVKETPNSILVDGKKKPGFMTVPYAFNLAIDKIKQHKLGIYCGGVTNSSPAVGMIGYFARQATDNNLIYLGFHNSMSYLVPHGAKKAVWGTNPITIGIPSKMGPVIWDSSSSKISVGEIVLAKRDGKQIAEGVGVDKEGNPSTDPIAILSGGILPFAGHKGSGMAMMVELLAGALMSSSITPDAQWNWGSFFILIDPSIFRPIEEYKNEVSNAIKLLKQAPKADGFSEIYYPGEQSNTIYKNTLKTGEFNLSDSVYKDLINIIKEE